MLLLKIMRVPMGGVVEVVTTHQHDDSPGAQDEAAERPDWTAQTEYNGPKSFTSTRHDRPLKTQKLTTNA